jgi:regulator of replication initiation timing
MSDLANQEPMVEVETNTDGLVPPAGVIPGVQVEPQVTDENVLFSNDENDFILDTGADNQMTPEQQQEEIKRLQAEMAKREELQNQQQVFQSGFETMADKFGDVAKTQQEAYKKLQQQQAAELAQLRQQTQSQPVSTYTDEAFGSEIFTNPAQAVRKYLVTNVGPVFNQLRQENAQLRQRLDSVSSQTQYSEVYTKYKPEIEFQAQQLATQGVKNPYELAVQIVKGKHVEDFVQTDQSASPIQQPAQPVQPTRQPGQQSFSPTASQVPKAPVQQTRGKKRIPQSLYNEWVAEANEKGLDVKHWTQLKAEHYEG